jgi:hypothetical protein
MSIYHVRPTIEKFKAFFFIDDDENLDLEFDGYFDFKGETLKDNWHGARVFARESFKEDEGKLPMPDIIRFNASALAYSEKAVNVLKDVLEESGELLEFEYEDEKWWVHHVTNIVNAIDFEKSKLELESSGAFEVTCTELDEKKLSNVCIFKQKNISSLMGHDNANMNFKALVESSNLSGVDFEYI